MTPTVLVAVATYRRPDALRTLLNSISENQVDARLTTLVVDNDPNRSAEPTVAACADAIYDVETTPGVAAVRTKALTIAADYDYIAFVDDDERVPPHWLQALLDAIFEHGSDAAGGPVESVLPPTAPKWIVRGGFIARPLRQNGPTSELLATNNSIVSVPAIRAAGIQAFDSEFGHSGGEDSEFFWRLQRSGATYSWTNEALVFEDIPIERLNARWVLRRAIQNGGIHARLDLRDSSRWRIAALGVARIASGIGIGLADLARMRGITARSVNRTMRGVGYVAASFGYSTRAYGQR